MRFDRAMFCVVGFLITRNSCMILIKYVVLLVFIPKRQNTNKQTKKAEQKQNHLYFLTKPKDDVHLSK